MIHTERLTFREFLLSDAPALHELNSDPEVMRYTGDKAFQTEQAAEAFIENYSDYDKNGFGRWAVIRNEDQVFIGWCGLKLNELNLVDLGFRFLRHEWGKGYATESSRAVLKYGFETFDLSEIIGRAAKSNPASIHVLEKIGMQFWKEDGCKGIQEAVYYRMSKEEFSFEHPANK